MAHILAVDDDADLRALLKTALERDGHQVTALPGGAAVTAEHCRWADCILLDVKGPDPMKRLPGDLPLLVYLLHPLFLILVRGFAGVTGLTVFTENSVVHFLAVAAASFAGSWILAILWALAKARILPGLVRTFSRKIPWKPHSPR